MNLDVYYLFNIGIEWFEFCLLNKNTFLDELFDNYFCVFNNDCDFDWLLIKFIGYILNLDALILVLFKLMTYDLPEDTTEHY